MCYVQTMSEQSSHASSTAGHGALRTGGVIFPFPNSRSRLIATSARPRGAIQRQRAASRPEARVALRRRLAESRRIAAVQTTVRCDTARKVHLRNDLARYRLRPPINPYRGCEHGCGLLLCAADPRLSRAVAGLDFESKLFAKPGRARRFGKELAGAGITNRGMIAIGTKPIPTSRSSASGRSVRGIL